MTNLIPDELEPRLLGLINAAQKMYGAAHVWNVLKAQYGEELALAYLRELQAGVQPAAPATPPGDVQTARRALQVGGKHLSYDLCAYEWPFMSDDDWQRMLSALAAAGGWSMVGFEVMARLAWWPRGEAVDSEADFEATMRRHIDRLAVLVRLNADYGFWSYVVDDNSNGDANKKLRSVEPLRRMDAYFREKIPSSLPVIRLPVSETDSDLDARIREDYIGIVEAGWPDEKTSAMSSRRSRAKYAEKHMGHLADSAPGGGETMFAVTDTGSILIELCGSVTGSRMNAEKAAAWERKMAAGGNSRRLYALGTGFDAELIAAVGRPYLDQSQAPLTPSPGHNGIVSIKKQGDRVLRIEHRLGDEFWRDGYPAFLLNGHRFDDIKRTNAVKDLKNVYEDGAYWQRIDRGDPVTFEIATKDGKHRSGEYRMEWLWDDTPRARP